MLSTPFLTDIDPRARIRGSRDPLGTQTVWAHFGRRVVGNLTTITTSARQFTTLLLGYYFAERAAERRPDSEDLAVFLKWEQLAGYARWAIHRDADVRGIERVKRNLADSNGRIRLGADAQAQILSNQKMYGLWGLYTVAARASGLIEGDPTRVTEAARELIERRYLPLLNQGGEPNGDRIISALQRPIAMLDTEGRDQALFAAVGRVLKPRIAPWEREVLRRHLVCGGPNDTTGGRQEVLARIIESLADELPGSLSYRGIRVLVKECRSQGEIGIAAAQALERIAAVESFLAPAAALFDLLLSVEGQTLAELARTIRRAWGPEVRSIDFAAVEPLEPELAAASGDAGAGARWIAVARDLAGGRYEQALRLLVEQNRAVMAGRDGSAPWIELRETRVGVRYRPDQPSALPEGEALADYWVHSYFLDSLLILARALRPEGEGARDGRPGGLR